MNERSNQPLPDAWVERIFAHMQGLYGSIWLDRWRSGETVTRGDQSFDMGLLNAKATWAQELGGFAGMPERIKRAIESCRHRNMPPTLPEFLDLCRQGVSDGPKALREPRPSAEEVAPKIAAIASKVGQPHADMIWWAKNPPSAGMRGPWESAICECVEKGDSRFRKHLKDHVAAGICKSDRAVSLVTTEAE